MPDFIRVPIDRLDGDTLSALLEEFASRDGTDYGESETPLDQRVSQLRHQLDSGEVQLLFEASEERWDLVSRQDAEALLSLPEDE
ncbi:MAG: YheU family protein [Pseudomonadota bacterium]